MNKWISLNYKQKLFLSALHNKSRSKSWCEGQEDSSFRKGFIIIISSSSCGSKYRCFVCPAAEALLVTVTPKQEVWKRPQRHDVPAGCRRVDFHSTLFLQFEKIRKSCCRRNMTKYLNNTESFLFFTLRLYRVVFHIFSDSYFIF